MSDLTYRILKWIAIIGVVMWVGYEGYRHFAAKGPGDLAYHAAGNMFKDGDFTRAAENYRQALDEAPDHTPAMRGLANSLIQLRKYHEALAILGRAMQMEPEFAGHYATRAIAHDHLGKYRLAIADYQKALSMDPELNEGMHWLDRLLYNVQKRPSTIADRLRYLTEQMALPETERLLKVPELDKTQRPYEK